MKEQQYAAVICREFCRYFREGAKEEMHCGTYDFLTAHLTPRELRSLIFLAGDLSQSPSPDFSHDAEIKELICNRCDFRIDGCDFREDCSGPPCGGYLIVERLLR